MSKQSDDLVREIDEIRERLAGTVDELVDAVPPKNMLRRGLHSLRSKFVDENGAVKTGTVVPLVGGVVVVIVGAVVVRRIAR
ncbi:MAG: DUF3618 domain-containing protein [Aeromicrobium sp.]